LNNSSKYEPVIGLEIHAQMLTNSKAFCKCSTDFNSPANSNVCPVCLGHPGVLPVLNEELVNFILKMGIATNCHIRERSIFARKNYFYPDLSKGYQISQFETPICYNGKVNIRINGTAKTIGITRIHMEEDAGKSIHDFSDNDTLIDFNRCGVPLIEIVSEPDINSTTEALQYLQDIRQILIYLGINDGNMEEGSLRCDANVSIRPTGTTELGTRTEIKNLNSFKNVVDAIEAEINRQSKILDAGNKVNYHTMNYNAKEKTTTPMRTKEEAHDYRYFPEPDLVYVVVNEQQIERIKNELPELHDKKIQRYISDYGLPVYDAEVISADKSIADFFDKVVSSLKKPETKLIKQASNWIMTEVLRILNENKINIDELKILPPSLATLVEIIDSGQINHNAGKEVFNELYKSGCTKAPVDIINERNLSQLSDSSEIETIVQKILSESQAEVERFKEGETKLRGFFVGKVMKESKGKANPKIVNEILLKKLSE